MKEWNWSMMANLTADEAQQEAKTVCLPGNCPCSCLRNMVEVLDAASPEQAVLQAQVALGDVTGRVVLSVYRQVPGSDLLELIATGHDAYSKGIDAGQRHVGRTHPVDDRRRG
jgi:hypothetical protein